MSNRLYTIDVFAHGPLPGRCTRRKAKPVSYGYQGWNPDNSHEPGRLPTSGCFTWVGCVAARKAAMGFLAIPAVYQVQIKTNQSRKLYLWNKCADGTVYGYRPD